MDPEQIYQEVLQEEQKKGVSPAVAEGRAKAARQRAIHGSPHPKEPKWWAGAQPHLEGGEGAPAEVEEPAEEPAEAEPAAEQPAAEAPAQGAPAHEEAPAPAAEAQPAQPSEPAQPAAQPAATAQPAPAAVATAPAPAVPAAAYQPTIGTSPGTPTGNRLRPEDAVATEAQFDGQRAMEQRRKLIDELVSTGVPAVTAADTGRRSSPWVSVLFLLVPLLAILFLVSNEDLRETAPAGGTETQEPGGGGGESAVVAADFAFEPQEITVKDEVTFENEDTAAHNIYIYPDEQAAQAADASQAIFEGEDVEGGGSMTYDIGKLEPGTYPFICQLHPSMTGSITIE